MTKKSEARTLQVKLEYLPDSVSVMWSQLDGQPDGQIERYYISKTDLIKRSRDVRDVLTELQACDPDTDDPHAEYAEVLRKLARAGEALYSTLFTAVESDEIGQYVAAEARSWFEEEILAEPEKHRIQFVHSQSNEMIAPWGLVFTPFQEGEGDIDALGADFDDYRNFWCNSFRLACGAGGSTFDKFDHPRREAMHAICVMEWEDDEMDAQQRDRDLIEVHKEVAPKSKDRISALARDHGDVDQFWYFSLRATEDGSGYHMGGDLLHSADFKRTLRKHQKSGEHLAVMLLDGDGVIRHDRGATWVQYALELGRSGLIAVETDITNPDLRRFGWHIISYMIRKSDKDRTFIQSIAEMRRDFWPQSLLYGVYCDPSEVYFDPKPIDFLETVERSLKIPMLKKVERALGGRRAG